MENILWCHLLKRVCAWVLMYEEYSGIFLHLRWRVFCNICPLWSPLIAGPALVKIKLLRSSRLRCNFKKGPCDRNLFIIMISFPVCPVKLLFFLKFHLRGHLKHLLFSVRKRERIRERNLKKSSYEDMWSESFQEIPLHFTAYLSSIWRWRGYIRSQRMIQLLFL